MVLQDSIDSANVIQGNKRRCKMAEILQTSFSGVARWQRFCRHHSVVLQDGRDSADLTQATQWLSCPMGHCETDFPQKVL